MWTNTSRVDTKISPVFASYTSASAPLLIGNDWMTLPLSAFIATTIIAGPRPQQTSDGFRDPSRSVLMLQPARLASATSLVGCGSQSPALRSCLPDCCKSSLDRQRPRTLGRHLSQWCQHPSQ